MSGSSKFSDFIDAAFGAKDSKSLFTSALKYLGPRSNLDSAVFFPFNKRNFRPLEWSGVQLEGRKDKLLLECYRELFEILGDSEEASFLDKNSDRDAFFDAHNLKATIAIDVAAIAVLPIANTGVFIGLNWTDSNKQFSAAEKEIFNQSKVFLEGRIEQLKSPSKDATLDNSYQRLVDHADGVFFSTDLAFNFEFLSRKAVDFFGHPPEDFVEGNEHSLFDLIHPHDRDRIQEKASNSARLAGVFDDEFRIINLVTGNVRWLLVHMVPLWQNDKHVGWDGFAIDITLRREALEALEIQSKKVRALYTVSSAIRGYIDPSNIASRGLNALCDATGADAGLCFSKKAESELELVSHHGFSSGFAERIKSLSNVPSLSRYVAEHSQSVVVPDLEDDPRASKILLEEEGVRSAVLVPICVENETIGTLGLFSKHRARFDGGDVMLISAAANQIGLAERQATLFAAFRKQTKVLSALYRMSHELNRNLSLDEIFETAFSIMREELGLKRQWIGLLNETSTRIIGQAAHGSGWRRKIVELNVEIQSSDHPIAKVVSGRKPIVINNPEELLKEFGLKRVFSRLGIDAVALVPLIAGGQILGVLGVQPGAGEPEMGEEELGLLSNLANEIASTVLAKRFEERTSESERMRTTGHLAAGISHNFNNLLQAIIGQASLLALQSKELEPEIQGKITKAAEQINESANKGAGLVKQLLSFSQIEEPLKEICDVNDLISRSIEKLKSKLEPEQEIILNLDESVPKVYADPGQLLRILRTLISNSSEAIADIGQVEVFTNEVEVNEQSPHFEVPYGQYVRIGVRDNGVGMDEETKKRCFEPFYTTRDVDPGSGLGLTGAGLGLAAAYALARSNGGRLVAEGRVGHGAVFTIFVPVAASLKSSVDVEKVLGAKSEKKRSRVEKGSSSSITKFFSK